MTEKESVSRGKQWVVKSNDYIQAKFTNYKPTLAQNRVVLWLASQVHSQHDKEFNEVRCSAHELRTIMKLKHNKERLIEELGELRSATAVMKRGSLWTIFGIIDRATFDEETEEVVLRLSEDMRPFLLNLGSKEGEGFTRIDLETIQAMRSVHSQRIYELLWQYRNLNRGNSRAMKLHTLKEYLGVYAKKKGVVHDSYPRWMDFQKRVLIQAEKDLCNAGLMMSYFPIKEGRKVVSVQFIFMPHKDEKGDVLDTFKRLTLTTLDQYEKVQLANLYSYEVLEKAVLLSNKQDSIEPLKALIPKTKKVYQDALMRRWESSQDVKLKQEEELWQEQVEAHFVKELDKP